MPGNRQLFSFPTYWPVTLSFSAAADDASSNLACDILIICSPLSPKIKVKTKPELKCFVSSALKWIAFLRRVFTRIKFIPAESKWIVKIAAAHPVDRPIPSSRRDRSSGRSQGHTGPRSDTDSSENSPPRRNLENILQKQQPNTIQSLRLYNIQPTS